MSGPAIDGPACHTRVVARPLRVAALVLAVVAATSAAGCTAGPRGARRRGGPGADDRVERREFRPRHVPAPRRRPRPRRSPPMADRRRSRTATTTSTSTPIASTDDEHDRRARRLRRRPGAPPSPTSVTRRPSGSSNPSTCRNPATPFPRSTSASVSARSTPRCRAAARSSRRSAARRTPSTPWCACGRWAIGGVGWSRSARTTPPTCRSAAYRI